MLRLDTTVKAVDGRLWSLYGFGWSVGRLDMSRDNICSVAVILARELPRTGHITVSLPRYELVLYCCAGGLSRATLSVQDLLWRDWLVAPRRCEKHQLRVTTLRYGFRRNLELRAAYLEQTLSLCNL